MPETAGDTTDSNPFSRSSCSAKPPIRRGFSFVLRGGRIPFPAGSSLGYQGFPARLEIRLHAASTARAVRPGEVRMGVWLGDLVSVLVAVVVAGTGCTSAREPAFLGAHRKGAGQPAE